MSGPAPSAVARTAIAVCSFARRSPALARVTLTSFGASAALALRMRTAKTVCVEGPAAWPQRPQQGGTRLANLINTKNSFCSRKKLRPPIGLGGESALLRQPQQVSEATDGHPSVSWYGRPPCIAAALNHGYLEPPAPFLGVWGAVPFLFSFSLFLFFFFLYHATLVKNRRARR